MTAWLTTYPTDAVTAGKTWDQEVPDIRPIVKSHRTYELIGLEHDNKNASVKIDFTTSCKSLVEGMEFTNKNGKNNIILDVNNRQVSKFNSHQTLEYMLFTTKTINVTTYSTTLQSMK